ncbi:hypothetical protein [Nocardia farcinica]|nr:hypothetical protein [Nocardia farcinica]
MRTTLTIAAACAAAVLVTGCGESKRESMHDKAIAAGMSEEQFLACEDFINGNTTLSPEDAAGKAELARKVNEWAQKSGPDFADAGDGLARAASGPASAWKLAADTFAGRCLQAGWPSE